jgi:hypothetical protein
MRVKMNMKNNDNSTEVKMPTGEGKPPPLPLFKVHTKGQIKEMSLCGEDEIWLSIWIDFASSPVALRFNKGILGEGWKVGDYLAISMEKKENGG